MTFVSDLKPEALWRHFDQILTIPRGSKNEEQMRRYVAGVADRLGLAVQVDGAGNLVVVKPASPGREGAPVTILQAHLDMVNEKNSDVDHDFTRDPLVPRRDGDFLKATGTTLGADNGIGVAAMLAVAEANDLVHGPLELLFTIDEETGLTGATELDARMLAGRQLINLDSEEEGTLTVGCAGGAGSRITLPLEREAPVPGATAWEITVAGLKGGHSGVDIHLQRGNASALLARGLFAAEEVAPLRLAAFTGGDKHNAIPREARAVVVTSAAARDAVREAFARELEAARAELRTADPGLRYEIAEVAVPERVWTEGVTRRALALLRTLPHGVLVMSYDIPGLVETSTNLATVAERDGALEILMSNRSSVATALRAVQGRLRALGELAGAKVESLDGYPGWQPNLASPLLAASQRVHEQLFGKAAHVGAMHAGLECGIVGEKVPGMDMISFGPTIQFPHSPDEQVEIPSVARFWQLLTALLADLAS
ncbi:MAG TPA: aminoacyl-histidine dipeptidase [Thermoanaerobaculia bacterium]|nr:aminoacyl-histidine dipeptidase [Thermoanaerobaculia bacterium]